jgi:glutathione S-transferase
MSVTLTVVHGSHACATAELALQRKGIPYKTVELPPPLHAAIQRVRTGKRTVPSMTLDGEKVSGSRAILRRLDAYVPTPPLYGTDDAERIRIEDAERWGEEELQGLARRILWPTLARSPESIPSFLEGSKLPGLPDGLVKASAPLITRVEFKLNAASQDSLRGDIAALPGMLDSVDALLADGTIGGAEPNAADLQIAPSLSLLMTIADLEPVFAGRPCAAWAKGLVPDIGGTIAPGVINDLLP